jgi:hypothetical protein
MKKTLSHDENMLSAFEDSGLENLASVFGGVVDPPATTTLGYETKSSATDGDLGDHDDDSDPA